MSSGLDHRPARARRPARTPRSFTGPLLLLTMSTGAADAVGYLALDKVFTGNMTGNVVILGMAVVPGTDLPVLGPSVALLAFMVGALVGGVCLRGQHTGWSRRVDVLFATVAATFGAIALYLSLHVPDEGTAPAVVVTGVLASAMGIQAAAARHVAMKDLTTVVVTSTITGLAADVALGGNGGGAGARRAGAVIAVAVGAMSGAALLQVGMWAGVALSASLVALAIALRPRNRKGTGHA